MRDLPEVGEIHRRLKKAIPTSVDPRGWARREMAAKTIFVMLYGGAIEGEGRWIRPTAVTDMTDAQSQLRDEHVRISWLDLVQSHNRPRRTVGRWYQENTREPIRDETLRKLIELGIAVERPNLATTSPKPRYALSASFAELLSPDLVGNELEERIEAWKEANLSTGSLARLALLRKGQSSSTETVLVRLPTGETRSLKPGPSAELSRAVVEEFASRFLRDPAVLLISESAVKVGYADEELLQTAHLEIDSKRTLPDVILMDLEAPKPLLVFVECVVTDGPVNARRRAELDDLTVRQGYDEADITYVTVFYDRAESPFQRMSAGLAWGSFVWFESEPDHVILLREGSETKSVSLRGLLDLGTGQDGKSQ